MKRLFGMMPSDEIEIQKTYIDSNGLKIVIQAGCHGWTVLWADGGNDYEDEDDTPQNNFNKAYQLATQAIGELKGCN